MPEERTQVQPADVDAAAPARAVERDRSAVRSPRGACSRRTHDVLTSGGPGRAEPASPSADQPATSTRASSTLRLLLVGLHEPRRGGARLARRLVITSSGTWMRGAPQVERDVDRAQRACVASTMVASIPTVPPISSGQSTRSARAPAASRAPVGLDRAL